MGFDTLQLFFISEVYVLCLVCIFVLHKPSLSMTKSTCAVSRDFLMNTEF